MANLVFVGILLAYTLGTIYFNHRFNSSNVSNEETPKWAHVLYYQFVFIALMYNLILMHLDYHEVDNAMFYLLLLSVFFCAGGVSSYQHLRWLGLLLVVTIMVPQVVYYLVVPGAAGGRDYRCFDGDIHHLYCQGGSGPPRQRDQNGDYDP